MLRGARWRRVLLARDISVGEMARNGSIRAVRKMGSNGSSGRGRAAKHTVGGNPSTVEDGVYERIFEAIVGHRLPPGAKLGEERLADALGVTRAQVREALTRLAHQNLVDAVPHRGAFIAQPSIKEAREIYAARRVIEAVTARDLAWRATAEQIRRLRESVERERATWAEGDRQRAIQLSRNFHFEIAEMAGNSVLAEILRGIISRVAIVVALYGRAGHADCFFEEHVELVDAIAAGEGERAADLMVRHIQHMEDVLNLIQPNREPLDLHKVFAEAGAKA